MLESRFIPVLLLRDKGLVKTVKFRSSKYVGDPLNAVKIFNEKEVDELVILDIDASGKGSEPDYKMIEDIAVECRMPLCYGGGVKTVKQACKILSLGVEKIAISSALFETPGLIKKLSDVVGSQSVIAVLDVRKRLAGSKYHCYIYNGKKNMKVCPFEFALQLQKSGVGEIMINSIDKDGTMNGYDFNLIGKLSSILSIPITALGGAGSINDMKTLINKHKIIGVAAGSLFLFKGKFRAVLINYPTHAERRSAD